MMGSKRVARKRVKSEGRSGLRVLATMSSGSVSTLSTGWTGGQCGRWWTLVDGFVALVKVDTDVFPHQPH